MLSSKRFVSVHLPRQKIETLRYHKNFPAAGAIKVLMDMFNMRTGLASPREKRQHISTKVGDVLGPAWGDWCCQALMGLFGDGHQPNVGPMVAPGSPPPGTSQARCKMMMAMYVAKGIARLGEERTLIAMYMENDRAQLETVSTGNLCACLILASLLPTGQTPTVRLPGGGPHIYKSPLTDTLHQRAKRPVFGESERRVTLCPLGVLRPRSCG